MFNKIQKTVGDALEFPPDVIGDGPKITITGRQQVIVENYKAINSFSAEEISLETAEGEFFLSGKGLVLKIILPTELRIEGNIITLGYRD